MKVRSSKVTNMTEGSPVGLILSFAVPMFIGNVFQQAYNMVDTMIAGRFLGEQAIVAIGAAATLYSLLMNITWGLNNGYCVVLSRGFGAGDMVRFRRSVAAMIGLNAGIALVLTALSVGLLRSVMRLLRTPADIFDQSWRYIVIILAGMITTVAYSAGSGYLRAMGNSRTPLVPALGYLGVAVTEPVIWCLCAAFLAASYVTVGRQKGDRYET